MFICQIDNHRYCDKWGFTVDMFFGIEIIIIVTKIKTGEQAIFEWQIRKAVNGSALVVWTDTVYSQVNLN